MSHCIFSIGPILHVFHWHLFIEPAVSLCAHVSIWSVGVHVQVVMFQVHLAAGKQVVSQAAHCDVPNQSNDHHNQSVTTRKELIVIQFV